MQLSRFSDYALRTLMYLACAPDGPTSVGQLSQVHGISFHHLAKTAQALAQRGWIETRRGRTGGLRLAISPSDLTVGRVIRELEPNLALVECFDPAKNHCNLSPACLLKHSLSRALEAFLSELDRVSLADLVQDRPALNRLYGIGEGAA
ncbi:MAG: Rrf2 family transcriptional regulator [Deltaproteobacteria bacterium]|nr:Rrf2 family transcriptional regulator [Deltaproteobacteria bacterium]